MQVSNERPQWRPSLGAVPVDGDKWSFLVWAPKASRVDVHIRSPINVTKRLEPTGSGYFYREVEDLEAGTHYKYRLDDGLLLPDPASRYQPEGVHGPSALLNPDFPWTDSGWRGRPLQEYVLYELHIGTFTTDGTFDAAIKKLEYLCELGVTAIEIMPVAQFPGSRNWGYDGVYPYAVQASYGGPTGLKRFVDAAHGKGLAVVLDVVYNHVGPEGNYLSHYGDYFTNRYSTPWGAAVNFDDKGSDAVRRFVIENALQWTVEFHIDALRLDAVHAIFDASNRHILAELTSAVHEHSGSRRVFTIAESNLNDPRIVAPPENGGYGFDAQWNDDFHHSLHALLTRERTGYYQDFGKLRDLAKAYEEGFVYSGEFSKYRRRHIGISSKEARAHGFVVFSQNHDQVGNRILGERLNQLIVREQLKLAAGAVILSPFLPMLFMGQEYAESSPFLYFVSHSDDALIEAVRAGRRKEFKEFLDGGEQPDPQAETTFLSSKLNHELRILPEHRTICDFYQELLRLRKSIAALKNLSKAQCEIRCLENSDIIAMRRWHDGQQTLTILHFGVTEARIELPIPQGIWGKLIDSSDERWLGNGTRLPDEISSTGNAFLQVVPWSVSLFIRRANVT